VLSYLRLINHNSNNSDSKHWWRSTGAGCPGRLWSLLLWRYSRHAWTRSCAACCGRPCFGRGVGLDDPQRSLPTSTILWFCEAHKNNPAYFTVISPFDDYVKRNLAECISRVSKR